MDPKLPRSCERRRVRRRWSRPRPRTIGSSCLESATVAHHTPGVRRADVHVSAPAHGPAAVAWHRVDRAWMPLAISRTGCSDTGLMFGRLSKGVSPASSALLLGAAWGAAGCTPKAPETPEAPAPLLAGRSRTVTFRCPPEQPRRPSRDPVRHPLTCARSGRGGLTWANVDPPRPVPLGVPPVSQGGGEYAPCLHGISICWVDIRAPEGSRALTCRDAEGQSHGPVEVVAPDGSLIAQGLCVHGMPSGTWFGWRHEKLAGTRTFEGRSTDDLHYVAPDQYRYGAFPLVPIEP
jgi:hypothetical protein